MHKIRYTEVTNNFLNIGLLLTLPMGNAAVADPTEGLDFLKKRAEWFPKASVQYKRWNAAPDEMAFYKRDDDSPYLEWF